MTIDIEIMEPIVDQDSFWFGGISARSVVHRLDRHAGDDVDVWINSPGGSASAGVAIANRLLRHGPEVRMHVLGVAASAAAVVALGPGTDVLDMPAGTFAMIHRAHLLTIGHAADLRKDADLLEKYDVEIARLLASGRLSDLSQQGILELMHADTWISSEEMAEAGRSDAGAAPGAGPANRLREKVLDSLAEWGRSETLPAGWHEHVAPLLADDGEAEIAAAMMEITEILDDDGGRSPLRHEGEGAGIH